MFTDDTILDYGAYKNKKVKELPHNYLINVYRSGGDEHEGLKQWINANIQKFPILNLQAKKGGHLVTFKCDKRTFPTKKDAMDSIVRPVKAKKPIPLRAYECPECSMWHLTSRPDRRFADVTDPEGK